MLASHLRSAILAAFDAGMSILDVYARDFTVDFKEDSSPLTEADRAAHEVITTVLGRESDLPILSEEGRTMEFAERAEWSRFWLVDPLDGTKEFVKRNGEFTVNIALIEDGCPIFGIVFTPVGGVFHLGLQGVGAFRGEGFASREALAASLEDLQSGWKRLPLLPADPEVLRVVASRSHRNEETEAFIKRISAGFAKVEIVSSGSSLKLCRVAEGTADVYPRIAPTCEWDTGAAQAVVEAAGGRVLDFGTGEPLRYNKENLLNPYFVVERAGFSTEWS